MNSTTSGPATVATDRANGSLLSIRPFFIVKELSFIDDGLWGFEVMDADGYVIAFVAAAPQVMRDR
jgi:hypothetical protein